MNERGAPQRKGGLGRGLAALIPTGPPVVDLASALHGRHRVAAAPSVF